MGLETSPSDFKADLPKMNEEDLSDSTFKSLEVWGKMANWSLSLLKKWYKAQDVEWVTELPPGWRATGMSRTTPDGETSRQYYNTETGVSTWKRVKRPSGELPPGWREEVAKRGDHKGTTYYYNKETGESTWVKPLW